MTALVTPTDGRTFHNGTEEPDSFVWTRARRLGFRPPVEIVIDPDPGLRFREALAYLRSLEPIAA